MWVDMVHCQADYFTRYGKKTIFFAVSLLTTPEGICSHGKIHKKPEFLSCADKTSIPGSVSQRAYLNQLDPARRRASKRHTLTSYRE